MVSLSMELGKGKSKKKSEAPLKTYINFAEVRKEKTTNWALVLPGLVVIVLFSYVFSRFAVLAMFERSEYAKKEIEQMQLSLDKDIKIISESNNINDTFYHYTWSDMDDEEKNRIPRVDILQLVREISQQKIYVENYSVQNNLIAMDIHTDSLSRISELCETLDANPNVESVVVSSAQKVEVQKENGPSGIIVQSQIRIYLKALSARSE